MIQRKDYFIKSIVPQCTSFEKEWIGQSDSPLLIQGFRRSEFKSLFEELIQRATNEVIPIEVVHHPLDNFIEGLFFPKSRKLVYVEDLFSSNKLTFLNLIEKEKHNHVETALQAAQSIFEKAHHIHDQKESIYISAMDFEFLDILIYAMQQRLIKNSTRSYKESGHMTNRFFGAPLPSNNIDYINELTDTISKRYLLKGRPGSGKSTFLKQVANFILENGYDIEMYHCSMDPKSIDMIICHEIDVAIFDCTFPHEKKLIPQKDEVIDLYKECLPYDIDNIHKTTLGTLDLEYKNTISKGKEALGRLADAENAYYQSFRPIAQEEYLKMKETILNYLFY